MEKVTSQFNRIDSAIIKLYYSWKHQLNYEFFDFSEELKNLMFYLNDSKLKDLFSERIYEYYLIFLGVSFSLREMTDCCTHKYELPFIGNEYVIYLAKFNHLKEEFKDEFKIVFSNVIITSDRKKKWYRMHQINIEKFEVTKEWYAYFEKYALGLIAQKECVIEGMKMIEEYFSQDELQEYKNQYKKFLELRDFKIEYNLIADITYRTELIKTFQVCSLAINYFETVSEKIIYLISDKPELKKSTIQELNFFVKDPLKYKSEVLLKSLSQLQNPKKEKEVEKDVKKKIKARMVCLKVYFLWQSGEFKKKPGQINVDIKKEIADEYGFHSSSMNKYFSMAISPNSKKDILNFYEKKPDMLINDIEIVIPELEKGKNLKAIKIAKSLLESLALKSLK